MIGFGIFRVPILTQFALRVPSDISAAAKRFSGSEEFDSSVVELELKPLVAGKTPQGWDCATYAFVYPGTSDVEAVLSFHKHPTRGLEWEISRVAGYRQRFYKDGKEIVTMERGSNIGYFWGIV